MASVPLAALAVRPVEQPDMLGNYAKLVQLKGLMQQQQYQQQMQPLQLQQAQGALQLQGLQTQEAQRTLERNQAMDQAFGSGGYTVGSDGTVSINRKPIYDYLNSHNAGSLIPQLETQFSTLDEKHATTQKALADTAKAQGETAAASADYFGSMGAAIQAAKYDPVVAANILGHAATLGGPYAGQAKQMYDHIQQNPQDLQQITDEMIAASPKTVESQLKQVQTQTATAELPGKTAAAKEQAAKQQELEASGLTPSQFEIQTAAAKAQAEAKARLGSEMTLANYNKQLAQQNIIYEHQLNGITDAFTNPQHGYSQTLSQITATKNAIANAKTGNELAASMAPVMTAMGVASFAGIHRVPPAEVQAAGPAVGSVFRQIDAKLEKWGEGKLAPGTANEMAGLMDDLLNAKYNTVLSSAQLAAANGHIPQDKVFVMDKLGQTIPLSQAKAAQPSAAPLGFSVGDSVTIKGQPKKITKVYPNGSFDTN